MEWRQQTSMDYDSAFSEAQRWIEAVTKKRFGSCNFRSSLENGVLLCDLINNIRPGIIKKLNRLSTPIAGLDNLNLFLKGCGKLGLNQAQLFDPGDLQDLSTRVTVKRQESSRRLKNVLITLYWLGRKALADPFYNGPYLNLKAFEGLLGTALYKALEDCTSLQGSAPKGSCSDSWYSEKEELLTLLAGHKREDSLDSLDSLDSRTYSTSPDATLKANSEGCGSDPEADLSFMMSESKEYRRSLVVTPKVPAQFNQFLPTKDKPSGYVPAPLRKKRVDRNEENRQSWGAPLYTDEDGNFSSRGRAASDPSSVPELKSQSPHLSRAHEYESSDSDADRPDPDLVLDDLASRRFHSPSHDAPTNFAIPMKPLKAAAVPRTHRPHVTVTNIPPLTHLSTQSQPLQKTYRSPGSTGLRIYDDSEEEDDEFGYADPVQDDLYTRKVGLVLQSSATVPFDKFLPKFWTPEEDEHVKKIKLGSQRRPWYRKIQGFSHTRSGSFSDDSDGDISPWLSVPPFARTQSEPPPSHPHTPEDHAHPSLTTNASLQTPAVAQQSPELPKLDAPDFWPRPDPTSGPRLIKSEKRPLLGREHPNDPYNVSADILPDLENDDMFTRRTKTFHSNDDLAKLKYGNFLVPRRRSANDVTVVTPRREGEPVYPDIEKDDVVFRKIQQQLIERPLSGTPDKYHPVPIPDLLTLPPKLQAKVMWVPCEPRQRQHKPEIKHEVHLKADDMLLRKLKALNTQGIANATGSSLAVPSVPSSCSEEDLQKWQTIRESSRLTYRKRLIAERLLPESPSNDGSKSISDITEQINLSNMTRELRFEELRKMREQMKESEEKWQDDLTRWKNKRRSVTSDIVKKKEERDEIEQITSDSRFRRSKTFSEMQDDRESRGRHRNSFNFSSDEVFEDPVPKTRTLPPRSYTIDTPYAPTDKASVPSVPSLKEEEPVAGTPALDDTDLPAKRERTSFTQRNVTNSVIKSQTTTRSLLDDPVPAISSSNTSQIKPTSLIKPTSFSKPSATSVSETSTTSTVLESSKSISSTKPVENSSVPVASLYKPRSVETKQPDQVPVPLPRSYPRSDSARLTSVVTPRPFGMQSNRIASLPRTFTVDDSQKRMNGDNIRKPTVPSRYAQFAAEDENLSQGSPAQSSNEEEEEEKSAAHTHSSVPLVNRVSPLSKTYSPHSSPDKEDYSDMRISLNQRPNSSQDFGFQTNWDSTGVRVKSVVPGSPAELGQLKVGDEILMVNGHKVADMSYNEWKNRMDEALKQGALLMDVRSHGRNSSPESHLSANLDFTSQAKDTVVKTVNVSSQPSNNYGSNGINGGLRKESDAVNYKESESISLKNLKRRSEFFEQGSAGLSVSSLVYLCGGSDTAIPNLPSPSITTSSIRSSWDQEDERKRQEKWQKEQERLLQEKYKKDQEKLEEEWKKAQQEFARNNKSETMQESARLQEEEKRRREQERQRLEEERRKREEQQRLEEERKKREEEERLRQETERKRREEERRQQEEQRRLREQDKVNSFGSTNAYRNLSYSHRSLSKSTPELDEVAKPDIKGVYGRHRGLAGWLLEEELRRKKNPQVQSQLAASELELERRSILNAMKYSNPERAVSGGLGEVGRDYKKEPQSQAELERQQILQEMKKKTSINTDKSWIRQQSLFSNTQKESVNLPMRRGESLDNLDVPRSSWRSSWAPSSTSSVPDYSRPYSAFSNSSTYNSGRPGSVALHTSQPVNSLRQSISQESQAPSRNRSVSGRKICSYCNTPLGKGAAMIIESLGLCYHLTCFKCINCRSELGGSEAGAEVRIRHQQLYCNTCYTRLKTGQPTAM
ncbi:LIM domain only protein 7 isoform X4 [Paramisgurnus dabryanus]|uniref:LIM domain only protein 7 isoform X4 n=1 Tax=Paramisgurnus dabryanus TaxID=90735 RepID=UPI0031F3B5CC